MDRDILVIGHTNYQLDTRVRNQCESLAQRHTVTVIAKPSAVAANPATLNGVCIKYVGSVRRTASKNASVFAYLVEYLYFFFAALRACLSRVLSPPAVVVIHSMPDLLVFTALPLLGRSRVVLDVHDLVPELFEMKYPNLPKGFVSVLKLCEKLSHKLADRRVTVNHAVAAHLQRRTGCVYEVFHNSPFLKSSRTLSRVDTSSDQTLRLVFLGNIHFRYKVDLLLKTVAELRERGWAMRIDVHGQGPAVDYLRRLVAETGAKEWAKIHGEYLPSEVPSILRDKDIGFVLADHSVQNDLAVPVKLLEYASEKVACISRGLATTREYFSEEAVFYFEDDDELERAIETLAGDKERRLAMTGLAFAAQEAISWEREAPVFCEFINGLMSTVK